jgi:MATE family multidrug resistance protein
MIGDWLGAAGDVKSAAVTYMRIRIYGAPAVLLTLASFGALRGKQDMKSPLWVALGVNALNIILDWVLIFGYGPISGMGVAGSALASTISQWLGAIASILLAARGVGLRFSISLSDTRSLMSIGSDMFIRTALLNLFIAYTTRGANSIGADAGAAHQIVRQMWVFTALTLDAFAAAAQSLVGFFIGQGSIKIARKVASTGMVWSIGSGAVLGILMWLGRSWVIQLMVPDSSIQLFLGAWLISAIGQPINAVSFLTDGVHWGTGDFPYLRNAMIVVSIIGMLSLWILERSGQNSLEWIWIITTLWVTLRAIFGAIRIWPGIGKSPLRA